MPWKPRAVVGSVLALLTAAVIHAQMQPGSVPPSAPPAGGGHSNPAEELERSIAGREKEPAGTVFKNVQILKQVPAGQLLDVMRGGFSRSLGVRCAHCHVIGEWDKDDKDEKRIAREMLKMTAAINKDQLKSIKGLHNDAHVTCATCHRGQTSPATSMEGDGEGRPAASKPGR